MTTPTPDELRKWAESLGCGVVYTKEKLEAVLTAFAATWEKDHEELLRFRAGASKLQDYIEKLKKQLAEVENLLTYAAADAWEADKGRMKFVEVYAKEVLKRWKSRPWETTDNAERHMKDVLAALAHDKEEK